MLYAVPPTKFIVVSWLASIFFMKTVDVFVDFLMKTVANSGLNSLHLMLHSSTVVPGTECSRDDNRDYDDRCADTFICFRPPCNA